MDRQRDWQKETGRSSRRQRQAGLVDRQRGRQKETGRSSGQTEREAK